MTISGAGPDTIRFDPPTCIDGARKASSCAQWNSGIALSWTESDCHRQSVTQLWICHSTASWVIIAPLGRDSVPLV
jgi:hypothetical protein